MGARVAQRLKPRAYVPITWVRSQLCEGARETFYMLPRRMVVSVVLGHGFPPPLDAMYPKH